MDEQQYRAKQYATFQRLGTTPSDWDFTGEIRELRDEEGRAAGTCQLCMHSPIVWQFVLASDKSTSTLGVGSECINTFPLASAGPMKGKSEVALDLARQKMRDAKKVNRIIGWLRKPPYNMSYADAKLLTDRIPIWLRKDHNGDLGLDIKLKNNRGYGYVWSSLYPDRAEKLLRQIKASRVV